MPFYRANRSGPVAPAHRGEIRTRTVLTPAVSSDAGGWIDRFPLKGFCRFTTKAIGFVTSRK